MPDTAAPGPAAAGLAAIRERNERHIRDLKLTEWTVSREPCGDVRLLLGVLEAVLKLHVRQAASVRVHHLCPEHASLSALKDKRVRAAIESCAACTITQQFVCQHCSCPNEEWPCLTRRVITAELLGKDGPDGPR